MVKRFLRDNPIHKKIVPFFDYFFLMRPTLYFGVWVMVVLGMAMAKMTMINHPLWISTYDYSTFFVFLGITLLCSSTFIINQIHPCEFIVNSFRFLGVSFKCFIFFSIIVIIFHTLIVSMIFR